MHFYKFYINDYSAHTRHLSNDEDLCYRRLLDLYYTEEGPIPLETEWVARRIQMGSDVIATVLNDFFTETQNGWVNNRVDREIAEYHAICSRNKNNGKGGGRPSGTKRKPKGNPVATEKNPDGTLSLINNQQSDSPKVPNGDSECDSQDGSLSELSSLPFTGEFLTFWNSYPEKKGKAAAWKAWQKTKGRPGVSVIVSAIHAQQMDRAEARKRGEFYPEWKNPATWLHGACWDDGLKYPPKKEKAEEDEGIPENWMSLLVDQYPENYPDGMGSSNFPSSFRLLPESIRSEIREAAALRGEISMAIRKEAA